MQKYIAILFYLLCYSFGLHAQDNYKRLYTGDSVPDLSLSIPYNYPASITWLSEFRGKCIILDFWSIYCSSCIAGFAGLQALQQQFPDDLQVLLVTPNSNEQVEVFRKRFPFLKKIKLPIVTDDIWLSNFLFPHATVPYQVWIDRNGRVRATTSASSATVTAVRDLIQDKPLSVATREDRMDTAVYRELRYSASPLFKVDNGSFNSLVIYFSTIPGATVKTTAPNLRQLKRPFYNAVPEFSDTPYYSVLLNALPGIKPVPFSGILLPGTNQEAVGIRYLNKPLYYLLQAAYDPGGDMKLLVDKETGIEGPPAYSLGTMVFSNWYSRDRYCYEIKMAGFTEEKALVILQQDIEHFFGIHFSREKRLMSCLVLSRISRRGNNNVTAFADTGLHSEAITGDLLLQKMSVTELVQALKNYYRGMNDPVIINETGIAENNILNIYTDAGGLQLPLLKKQLACYGLELHFEDREVDVLVISPSVAGK